MHVMGTFSLDIFYYLVNQNIFSVDQLYNQIMSGILTYSPL